MPFEEERISWCKAFGELLFPPRCAVCLTIISGMCGGICPACLATVEYLCSPLCTVCGKTFANTGAADHVCGECLRKPPVFTKARGLAHYTEPVRSLLHNLKYSYDTAVLPPLLQIARGCDYSSFLACDFFIPVPLYRSRLKKRGFNQALVLARLLFPQRRDDILPEVLFKQRNTVSQTKLDGAGRRRNLSSAFALNNPEILRNKTICLVDDIYTTGTTVSECARVLKTGGAREIVVLTFARVAG